MGVFDKVEFYNQSDAILWFVNCGAVIQKWMEMRVRRVSSFPWRHLHSQLKLRRRDSNYPETLYSDATIAKWRGLKQGAAAISDQIRGGRPFRMNETMGP
jgi:hypothetical protein